MKKFLALFLALAMVLSLAACAGDPAPTTQPTSTQPPETQPAETQPAEIAGSSVIYLSLTLADSFDQMYSLTASDDGTGNIYIEYVGDVKKVGTFDAEVLTELTAQLAASGLAEHNGQSVYEDGERFASMFVQYADDSYLTADYSGNIPQAFADGYNALADWFAQLTKDLPEYVPQPMVMGAVNETLLDELMNILNTSGMESLDMFSISDIPVDEAFGFSTGLTSAEGIVSGAACSPMMMTTPYSLVVVTVEDASKIDAVCADFAANIAWAKWICVSASDALVAYKGNMVICLMASDSLYTQCADAINNNGWTTAQALHNPNM